jgi:hypothetical protein
MASLSDSLLIAAGTLLVIWIMFDVFSAIVLPRRATSAFRLGPVLLNKISWPLFRKLASLKALQKWRNQMLAIFASLAFGTLTTIWLALLDLGYGLILFGMREDVRPAITTFPDALYFAGTSLLTLGFGDIVALSWRTRSVVLVAAISGLVFMALQVSYLFTLQSLVQQREQMVNSVVSRTGAPASGIILLLRYKELDIVNALNASFLQWETWIASILESHRAYVILIYFRSTNDTESWLSVLGAMLDAASLLLTSIEDAKVGEADLFYWLAASTVQAFCNRHPLVVEDNVSMTFEEFEDGLRLLQGAGYKTVAPEKAWPRFQTRRRGYIGYLNAMSKNFSLRRHYWVYDLFAVHNGEGNNVTDAKDAKHRPRV